MTKDKQIEEMRHLADEMGKAISNEYERRVLAYERKLEAVLKENGWRRASDVAREIFEEIDRLFDKHWFHHTKRLYDEIAELKKKYKEQE